MDEELMNGADAECGPAPRQIVESIVEQGRARGQGLLSHVEAVSFARRHGWKSLEAEFYARLGVLIVQSKEMLDDTFITALRDEVVCAGASNEVHVVLRTLLAALGRANAASGAATKLAQTFEAKLDQPSSAWEARLMIGGFIDRLERISPNFANMGRLHVRRRVADWAIEYHVSDIAHEFDLRSRAVFNAILSGGWSDVAAENVANGLDGAFSCAMDKLMHGYAFEWFRPFAEDLTGRVAPLKMFRRLSPETLQTVVDKLAVTRRHAASMDPATAGAITALEEAVHRPHRRQLDKSRVRLELELPGPRGFGPGTRLRVFDISRDGCLAVTDGPARFEQTAPPVSYELRRSAARSFPVHSLSGVVQTLPGDFAVRPGLSLVLHDASRRREWAVIDGASVVRVTPDEKNDRLWLGFHFDRVLPEVQQEIETLVYGAV